MKKIFFIMLCTVIAYCAFANGGENPLLGMWELNPQFILSGGNCQCPTGGGAIWNFIDDKTIAILSTEGGDEVEIAYKLDVEKGVFTIGVENDKIDIHYSVVDEKTIVVVVYLADNQQYNVAVLVRTGK
jgi:hypothetical protein